MREWRKILENPDYEVSEFGQVRNNRNGYVLLGRECGNSGYLIVVFSIEGKRRVRSIHRLVALNFIDNPLKKPTVNHIDGNKHNNCLSNLEWATHSENNQHSYDIGLKKYRPLHYKGKLGAAHNRSKKVFQYDFKGNLINNYGSASEAHRKTGINISDICKCANRQTYQSGGFVWSYIIFTESKFPKRPVFHLSKTVNMYNSNMELIKTFESTKAASQYVKCHQSCISDSATGKTGKIKGYIWKYN